MTLAVNFEAEQALLGCLLNDIGAFDRLPDMLKAEHFATAAHQDLFDLLSKAALAGTTPEPKLIGKRFDGHDDLKGNGDDVEDMKGFDWLLHLMTGGAVSKLARQFGEQIYDLAIRRGLVALAGDITASIEDYETPAKGLIERTEGALYAMAETGGPQGGFQTFSDALDGAMEGIERAFTSDGALTGLATDLIDLDQKLGGLHDSDLLILAGRPSMGKTALATNIAFNVAKRYQAVDDPEAPGGRRTVAGGRVGFYSLEMSKEQLAQRILADASGVSSDRMRKGQISREEFERIRDARDLIRNIPLHIDATGGLHIAKLAARARRQKRKFGLDLLIVDYLQLVTTDGGKGSQRVQEVTAITGGLKALAKELNIPIIALSQLSRQVESRDDKRPQLSDLRESGSIEQDADAVMFVYREAYYLSRSEPKEGSPAHIDWCSAMSALENVAEVIIGKQRHGPIGTIKLAFDGNTTRFGNLARDRDQSGYIDFAEPRPREPIYSMAGDQ